MRARARRLRQHVSSLGTSNEKNEVGGFAANDRGARLTPVQQRPADRLLAGNGIERLQDLCVIGLGHIGLPTALLFADAGLTVTGVDTDAERVAQLNAGNNPLIEIGLDALLTGAIAAGRFTATTQPVHARAYMIAVPTPLTPGRRPDLSHLWAAAAALADVLTPGALIVLESTCPIGTTERLTALLARLRPDLGFPGHRTAQRPVMVAYCPERVMPGQIVDELRMNDRAIGGLNPESAIAATRLYARIVRGHCHLTDAATAEMTKLAENAFRDVNIAFANELAAIAERHQIDPRTVIGLANRHPRVDILDPGPGVGGHCIPVDPWFLAEAAGDSARLIPAARAVNDARPGQIANRAAATCSNVHDPVIACFGLTYKRDVGDLRESPAVQVVRHLLDRKIGRILAVDPNVDQLPSEIARAVLVEAGDALVQADLLVLLVDHAPFKHLPVHAVEGLRILDTRGLWTLPDRSIAGEESVGAPVTGNFRPPTGPTRHTEKSGATLRFDFTSGQPAAGPPTKI